MLNFIHSDILLLIIKYLEIKDLINLRLTCKKFTYLSSITSLIINKITNNFDIIREYYIKLNPICKNNILLNYKIKYNLLPLEFIDEVKDKYLNFILDLKVTTLKNCEYDLKGIYFSLDLYFIFDSPQKHVFIKNLSDKIIELSEYANLKNQSVYFYGYRCEKEFDLYPIYHDIIEILQTIFFQEKNIDTKHFILEEMKNVQHNTNYGLFNNKFKFNDFLQPKHLPLDDLLNFKLILDNGLYLKKYYPDYLRIYLEYHYNDYIYNIDNNQDYLAYLRKFLNPLSSEYLGKEYIINFDLLLKDMGYSIQYLQYRNKILTRNVNIPG